MIKCSAKLAQVVIQRLRIYTHLQSDGPITPSGELKQERSSETICLKVLYTITMDANIHWIVISERYLSTQIVMVISCKRKTITLVFLNKTRAFQKTKVCYVSPLSSSHYQHSKHVLPKIAWENRGFGNHFFFSWRARLVRRLVSY